MSFPERRMKIALLLLGLLLLIAQAATAQEKIVPNQTVSRNIAPGKSELL